MKLATYKDGSRDGQLVVVSRDLGSAHYASGIAQRLQQVLDDWNFLSPQLQDLYAALNSGKARHAFAFDPAQCMAPLPRASHWAVGDAYRGLLAPGDAPAAPVVRHAAGDSFAGACDRLPVLPGALDGEAQLAAITADVPRAASPEQGQDAIRLLMLAASLRLREAPEHAHAWPATAFSPVAVTPDELGDAWQDGRVHLTLQVRLNDRKTGMLDTGPDMAWHFGELVAAAARLQPLGAGSVIGSGVVCNAGVDKGGRTEWPRGSACVAERRCMEARQGGAPATPWLQAGDALRIEMKGRDGLSVFGALTPALG